MGINIQKKKNEKPKHIVFLCHIVRIEVDKQGLDIFKPEKSCILLPANPKLCLMKSSTKRSGFGFQTLTFQKPSQKLHFGVTKKDTSLPFHFHVLNLFKSWSNLARIWPRDSNGHKNLKKWKTKAHGLLMSYSKAFKLINKV